MHEVSLVSSIVDKVREVAKSKHFERVEKIRLGIGVLSGVNPECIEFCFSEVTKDSPLEGAQLSLESIPLAVLCQSCGLISAPPSPSEILCTHCQSNQVQIQQGKDFLILDLEVFD